MVGIYKILSPSGKVYIGQSWNVRIRKNTYRRSVKSSIGRSLYNSIIKYGFDKHEFQIIHELPSDVTKEVMNSYETFYIYWYKDLGFTMMNLTDGGEGSFGYKHTAEAKQKISRIKSGKKLGDTNPNYGKGLLGEKNGMFGVKRNVKLIDKIRKSCSKPVEQRDKSNNVIKVWESVSSAAKGLNLKISNISACALNRPQYNTAGGFIWKYKTELA